MPSPMKKHGCGGWLYAMFCAPPPSGTPGRASGSGAGPRWHPWSCRSAAPCCPTTARRAPRASHRAGRPAAPGCPWWCCWSGAGGAAACRWFRCSQSHLEIVGTPEALASSKSWSMISRSRSPSHQATKFAAGMLVGDQLALGRLQLPDGRVPRGVAADGPGLGAGVAGIDVAGGAASGVLGGRDAPEHFAGRGVAERGAAVAALAHVLVHREDFEAGPRRIEVADVQRVAVAQPGVVERRAVVVDGHGAEDDLVLAVASTSATDRLWLPWPLYSAPATSESNVQRFTSLPSTRSYVATTVRV